MFGCLCMLITDCYCGSMLTPWYIRCFKFHFLNFHCVSGRHFSRGIVLVWAWFIDLSSSTPITPLIITNSVYTLFSLNLEHQVRLETAKGLRGVFKKDRAKWTRGKLRWSLRWDKEIKRNGIMSTRKKCATTPRNHYHHQRLVNLEWLMITR